MKVTVYNFKGGVGKTRIAVNLALTLSYGLITNDVANPLEDIFSESDLLKLGFDVPIPDIPNNYNVVFDLGGYVETRVVSALRQSDWVLVPFTNVTDEIEITMDTLYSVKDYNSNIIMILNKAVKGDCCKVLKILKYNNYSYPLFELKKSNALKNIFLSRVSVKEAMGQSPLLKYHYSKVAEQFEKIIEHMEVRENNEK